MHDYELVVVMNPDIPEDAVQAAIDRLTGAIAGRGGEVVEVNAWGRRKLAYPIRSYGEGNYVAAQIRLDPLKTHELEGGLAISEDVIRHLLIRKDDA